MLCVELAAEIGIAPPPCALWNTRRVNAGVRQRLVRGTASVVVTRGAIEQLDPLALRWVVAHELGHVADAEGMRRWLAARRMAVLTVVAIVLAIGLLPLPAGHLLGALLSVSATAAMLPLRRRMERAADRTAYACCAADLDAGRRALTAARASSGLGTGRRFRLWARMFGYPSWDERIVPVTD